ncbi:MAG: hypothetical protein Q4G68_09410 [Planctomycetia bacterium]|nr:hypothetical protein [Planctomycetia bacterium]
MQTRWYYFCLFCIAILSCNGCGQSLPEGVTKVVPVTLRVSAGGSPLTEADLQLVGEGTLTGIAVSGKTDAQGATQLKSVKANWIAVGAPVGKYRVVVNKAMPVAGEKSAEEVNAMSKDESMAYHAKIREARKKVKLPFPDSCTSSKTTPLSLEIKEDSLELALDLDDLAK